MRRGKTRLPSPSAIFALRHRHSGHLEQKRADRFDRREAADPATRAVFEAGKSARHQAMVKISQQSPARCSPMAWWQHLPALRRADQQIFLFGAAAFSRSIVWCFADMLLAFHARSDLGLDDKRTGLLLALAAGVGAASDLIVGSLFARFGIGGRAALVWQRWAMLACGICLVLQFLPLGDFHWLLCWSILFRIAFECVSVPQAMLMAWLPPDRAGVRRLVTLNATLGAAARLATAILTFAVIGRYQLPFAGREALLAGLAATIAIITADRLARVHCEEAAVPASHPPARGLGLPAGFVALAGAITLHASALYLLARLLIFTPRAGGTATAPAMLVLLTAGMMIGPWAADRLFATRRDAALPSTMVLLLASAALYVLLPASPIACMTAACLYGAALSASATLLWQALTVRVHRSHGAEDNDGGMAFSLFAFATKLGMVAGGWLTGLALDGFIAGDATTLLWILALTAASALACTALWATLLPRKPGRRLQQEEVAV
jgi:Na+/melibiose symporter-like transporter